RRGAPAPRGTSAGGGASGWPPGDPGGCAPPSRGEGRLDGGGILRGGGAAEAPRRHVPNDEQNNPDWRQGYGYQFWRCRHGAYRGDGAFGQYCVVMPEQQAVLAVTAGVPDMQPVLDLVWAHLLHDTTTPDESVRRRLRHLRQPALSGGSGSVSGTYTVADPRHSRRDEWRPSHERPPTIRAMAFAPLVPGGSDGWLVTLEDEAGTQRYRCID